jgi:hypothetical protein
MTGKKAQIEMSFQMIFSLILIAVFVFAAFYGIRYFLERAEQVQMGQFLTDLESKVNVAYQATEKSEVYTFVLPKSIKKVCFSDFSLKYDKTLCPEFEMYRDVAKEKGSNVFFCPPENAYKVGAPVYYRIDCEGNDCLRFLKQPYCIFNDNGVAIKLEKNLGEAEVVLS